jgi:hypothetical protein
MNEQQLDTAWSHATPGSPAHDALERTCRANGVISETLLRHGESAVTHYTLELMTQTAPRAEGGDALGTALYDHAAPLLGAAIARRAADDLARAPVVLTANHHGVDYFAQSVQGSLLFALAQSMSGNSASTITILACGNVPMNNLTFPLGMLFYQGNGAAGTLAPRRLPIFSDRFKRTVVSAAQAFDGQMLERAKGRLARMAQAGEVPAPLAQCAQRILVEDYADPAVLQRASYSEQATQLNLRLWRRLFAQPDAMPALVYVELEKVAAKLLEKDLLDPASLPSQVLFDTALRGRVMDALDGLRVCWRRAALSQRMEDFHQQNQQNTTAQGCGTMFFWGVDAVGRKVPLAIDTVRPGEEKLCGVDDRGSLWEIPFTPAALVTELRTERLIPSLFTCFLSVAFSRRVLCAGGYYQAAYLPAIQQGLRWALDSLGDRQSLGETIGSLTTAAYLSGMQMVMTRAGSGRLVPAGPLEIIAAGGLTTDDLERMGSMTLRNAHLASLLETLPDVAPTAAAESNWQEALAADCHRLLAHTVVVK